MPRLGRRTGQVVSALVTVVLVLGLWWLQSRGGGDGSDEPVARDPAPTSASAPTSAPASAPASMPRADEDGIPYVALDSLPREAATTVRLIDDGGPFPYAGKDGSTFGNFEGLLPRRSSGYYAEYTVPTPGASNRGARRIIAGDGGQLYWTADHYESFERIWRER
ncbi:ribonuclease domain-containing protein [Pimelobacter simplex]|uniref:ribonuclease domain-containing protein n=1 Tax=Nocardioides simplex TaxID=2045 RepID=UPI003670E209